MGRFSAMCAAAIAAAMLLAPFAAAQDAEEPKENPLKTERDQISYAIGLTMGESLKDQGVDVDTDLMVRGLRDALAGGEKLMTEREMMMALMLWQQRMSEEYEKAQAKAAEEALKAGEEFLKTYAEREGVVKKESGMMYRVIREGDGQLPAEKDMVSIHYTGKLVDGTEFDNSQRWGRPAELSVNGVIPGMSEALKAMKIGSKWEIVIPPALGYGREGAGDVIPPHSVLIFEVDLLSIVDDAPRPMTEEVGEPMPM